MSLNVSRIRWRRLINLTDLKYSFSSIICKVRSQLDCCYLCIESHASGCEDSPHNGDERPSSSNIQRLIGCSSVSSQDNWLLNKKAFAQTMHHFVISFEFHNCCPTNEFLNKQFAFNLCVYLGPNCQLCCVCGNWWNFNYNLHVIFYKLVRQPRQFVVLLQCARSMLKSAIK